jgi:hypothetical protein
MPLHRLGLHGGGRRRSRRPVSWILGRRKMGAPGSGLSEDGPWAYFAWSRAGRRWLQPPMPLGKCTPMLPSPAQPDRSCVTHFSCPHPALGVQVLVGRPVRARALAHAVGKRRVGAVVGVVPCCPSAAASPTVFGQGSYAHGHRRLACTGVCGACACARRAPASYRSCASGRRGGVMVIARPRGLPSGDVHHTTRPL